MNNQHFLERLIELTYQAVRGDNGIFKSFKDRFSSVIEEWKRSDRVAYTKAGNPKAPDVAGVVR
ncbi:Pogo transposable element with KRAB domainlike [Phytophthora palmivora]|uniref:Pogo transposable element with KRAB domainlike n=1 Tax=Phytophthora palmivora TaxID=4796 RepID=A0A2P4Y854_9STRA|nr:Pogo transposable element with KRAB domainlike [Phytophthora palmivora]